MHFFTLVSIADSLYRYLPHSMQVIPGGRLSLYMGLNNIGERVNNNNVPDLKIAIDGQVCEMNVAYTCPPGKVISDGHGIATLILSGYVRHRQTYLLVYTTPQKHLPQIAPIIVQPEDVRNPSALPLEAFFPQPPDVRH